MSIFKKPSPPGQVEDTAVKFSATIGDVVPLFFEAFTQNASDFVQSFKRRDPTLKGRSPEWTDELAMETYGLNRKEIALTALKAYLIFSVQEYLSIQHILDKKGREHLVDRMVSLLIDDRSKNCFEKEWVKIVQTSGDNVRKKELFVGNLLNSLGLVDSSFLADDLNKIWHHYVVLIDAMSSCVILHVDKTLNPRNHPTQKQLTDEYLLASADFRLDRKGIQQILERQ
jgi:hypothetical protein